MWPSRAILSLPATDDDRADDQRSQSGRSETTLSSNTYDRQCHLDGLRQLADEVPDDSWRGRVL